MERKEKVPESSFLLDDDDEATLANEAEARSARMRFASLTFLPVCAFAISVRLNPVRTSSSLSASLNRTWADENFAGGHSTPRPSRVGGGRVFLGATNALLSFSVEVSLILSLSLLLSLLVFSSGVVAVDDDVVEVAFSVDVSVVNMVAGVSKSFSTRVTSNRFRIFVFVLKSGEVYIFVSSSVAEETFSASCGCCCCC